MPRRSASTGWLVFALFTGLLVAGAAVFGVMSSQSPAGVELLRSDAWSAAGSARGSEIWEIDPLIPPILFDGSVYSILEPFPPIPDEIVLPLNPGSVRILKTVDYYGITNWSIDDAVHFRLIDRGSAASGLGYDIGTVELVTAGPLLAGNYGVTVSVSDKQGLTNWKTFTVVVTFASGIPFLAIVSGLAALAVGLSIWSVATVLHRRRTEPLESRPAGKEGVLLEETAARPQVSGRVSESSVMPVKRQDYRLPRRCPDCGAPVIWDEVEWVGPFQAKCPYCGAVLEATPKGV